MNSVEDGYFGEGSSVAGGNLAESNFVGRSSKVGHVVVGACAGSSCGELGNAEFQNSEFGYQK